MRLMRQFLGSRVLSSLFSYIPAVRASLCQTWFLDSINAISQISTEVIMNVPAVFTTVGVCGVVF
jgi:hypothetical protein